MEIGDLVVVPHGREFYVGRVAGAAFYDETRVNGEEAYRRPVEWLNNRHSIQRTDAGPGLQERMRQQRGTCMNASDLVGEIEDCLI